MDADAEKLGRALADHLWEAVFGESGDDDPAGEFLTRFQSHVVSGIARLIEPYPEQVWP
jgi:hypothetical protein